MKIVTPVVIIPETGDTVWKLSNEIAEAIQSGKIGEEMILLELPNDEGIIKIEGKTPEAIRDLIATQTENSNF